MACDDQKRLIDTSSYRIKRRLVREYWVDWALLAVVIGLAMAISKIKPTQNPFSLADKSISYPYKPKEVLSEKLCILLTVSSSSIIIAIFSLFRAGGRTLHHGILGLTLSNSLTLLVTMITKVLVGRHRPDWIARCQPELIDGLFPTDPAGGLSTVSICSQPDPALLIDGQKSFISGHAGNAFASFLFLTLFLAGRLRVFDNRGHSFKILLSVAPTLVGGVIAITRLSDYRHHWQDILAGALVGSLFAMVCYLQYFPSPFSADSATPHPCRGSAHHREFELKSRHEESN